MKRWLPAGPVDMRKPERFHHQRQKREVRGQQHTFDGAGEAKRDAELAMLERCGEIEGLERQVTFALAVVRSSFVRELVEAIRQHLREHGAAGLLYGELLALLEQYDRGEPLVPITSYKADSVYRYRKGPQAGESEVEDHKDGLLTPEYRIKRALMDAVLDVRIKESGPNRTTRGRGNRRRTP